MNQTTITELKRLQKEIDEAEARQNERMFVDHSMKDWDKDYNLISTNQQRIKEIIEQL